MNLVWISLVSIGMILLIIKNPEIALSTFVNGSEQAISLIMKLWAIYAFWLGMLKIIEDTQLNKKIEKFLSKPIDFVFGKNIPLNAKEQISINLSCNMLGMGNASIPSGIKAMEYLNFNKSKIITNSMVTFMILNTCNLQLFPTTIIGMKIFQGSKNSSNIVLPTIIVSVISVSFAILICKTLAKIFKDKLV